MSSCAWSSAAEVDSTGLANIPSGIPDGAVAAVAPCDEAQLIWSLNPVVTASDVSTSFSEPDDSESGSKMDSSTFIEGRLSAVFTSVSPSFPNRSSVEAFLDSDFFVFGTAVPDTAALLMISFSKYAASPFSSATDFPPTVGLA
jgi:hypothetical protein